MAPNGVGLAVCFLLLQISVNCLAQEILHGPENTTVFLDQSAVFSCETRGGVTSWFINGTLRRNLPHEVRNDIKFSKTKKNLTIFARAKYNGTIVQCVILGDGSSAESENATLQIEGRLSAVGDLRHSNNASSVTIWWTAPFSLDVTGVDPDIWYSVLIYNVTDEDNPTAILCTDCTNITETHYTFTPDYLSPCHVYNFSVTPFNGAGQGESSDNATTGTNACDFPTTPSVRNPKTSPTRNGALSRTSTSSPAMIGGSIAVAGVMVLVGFVIVLLSVVYFRRRRKRSRQVDLRRPETGQASPHSVECSEPAGTEMEERHSKTKKRYYATEEERHSKTKKHNYVNEEERHLLNSNSATMSSSLCQGGDANVDEQSQPILVVHSSSMLPLQHQPIPDRPTTPDPHPMDSANETLENTQGDLCVTPPPSPPPFPPPCATQLDAPRQENTENENEEPHGSVSMGLAEYPPTVETVMSHLYVMAGRWKEIAGALGFDEDLIDEIDTNNETDEECLQDCVEKWVSRMRPSREQLSFILTDLEEDSLPQQAGGGGQDGDVDKSEASFLTSPAESTSGKGGSQFVSDYSKPQGVDDEVEGTRGSKFTIINESKDSRVNEVRHFAEESGPLEKNIDVYSDNRSTEWSDDDSLSESGEEVEEIVLSSLSVTCKQEENGNQEAASFLLGNADHDVSALQTCNLSPTFLKPPPYMGGTTSLTTQETKDDEALEVSKKATGGCSTEGVTKPQPPKPTQPTRSASRKSNRKKKKKRGSPSPPARRNAKVLDHSRLMRIRVKKSSGNLPVD